MASTLLLTPMLFYLESKVTDADDYFYQALLCMIENDAKGAVGFIINRPFNRTLNELQEFAFLPPFPLYEGGPVATEHLYFLHRRRDIITGGKPVSEGMYFGGNFKQVTAAIAKGILYQDDIRIFIGYCGWDAGELEEEMKEDAWKEVKADVFL